MTDTLGESNHIPAARNPAPLRTTAVPILAVLQMELVDL